MSVEEAKRRAREACWREEFTGKDEDEARADAALDELIREVQAEMPCYTPMDGWITVHPSEDAARRVNVDCGDCPSCTARAEKVKV